MNCFSLLPTYFLKKLWDRSLRLLIKLLMSQINHFQSDKTASACKASFKFSRRGWHLFHSWGFHFWLMLLLLGNQMNYLNNVLVSILIRTNVLIFFTAHFLQWFGCVASGCYFSTISVVLTQTLGLVTGDYNQWYYYWCY